MLIPGEWSFQEPHVEVFVEYGTQSLIEQLGAKLATPETVPLDLRIMTFAATLGLEDNPALIVSNFLNYFRQVGTHKHPGIVRISVFTAHAWMSGRGETYTGSLRFVAN